MKVKAEQCLAMEVDKPEIDDIMREVFGDENILLYCYMR